MNEAVRFKSCARRARNAFRIEAEFQVFFFALLSFGEGVLIAAVWHDDRGLANSTLLFCRLALFNGGERGGFRRIGVAAHTFIVPAMEEFDIDIELIEYSRDGLIDDVIQRLGAMVEGRHGRKNNRAHARERGHRF